MFLFFCFLINSSPVVCLHVIGIYFAELEEAKPVEYRLIPNKTIFNTPIYEQGMAGMTPTTHIFEMRKKRKNRNENKYPNQVPHWTIKKKLVYQD